MYKDGEEGKGVAVRRSPGREREERASTCAYIDRLLAIVGRQLAQQLVDPVLAVDIVLGGGGAQRFTELVSHSWKTEKEKDPRK